LCRRDDDPALKRRAIVGLSLPGRTQVDWSRRNPGVAASRQSAAYFHMEFKWRLSPESRYADGRFVAQSAIRIPYWQRILFLNSVWDGRLGQLAVELEL
jgi:hypothetical protein